MIERKIVIGLITSTEYCTKIKDIWNIQLIESSTARLLTGWIWEYFNKYNKAPGKEIETIYYTKLKDSKIQKSVAEEIEEDILPELSKEYENEPFNLTYLLNETEKYFNKQHIKIHTETIQTLLNNGEIEKAEDLAKNFKPLELVSGKIDDFILTVKQIREKDLPKITVLMKPWLIQGQTTIIYGNYGSGKSLLTILIAYVIGLHDFDSDEAEIGEWIVKNPTGCLYVDGELGEREMEERIRKFRWLGDQSAKHRLQIFSIPEYQLQTEDPFYLSNRKNQQKIISWLKDHPNYKLIVLDSASTLFGLEQENDNSEWNNKINPFLRDLRALDVACIMLHHSGKDGKKGLRGASAMGAMAHNIFRLTNHGDNAIEKGEAWFVLSTDKQRAGGYSFKKFSLRYTQNEEKTETHWEVTNNI